MAKGYIIDELLNRKIQGETDLAKASDISANNEKFNDEVHNVVDTDILESSSSGIDNISGLVQRVDRATVSYTVDVERDELPSNLVEKLQSGDIVVDADDISAIVTYVDSSEKNLSIINSNERLVYILNEENVWEYNNTFPIINVGTKLYKHSLYLAADDVTLFIVNNNNTHIQFRTLSNALINAVSRNITNGDGDACSICAFFDDLVNTTFIIHYINNSGIIQNASLDTEAELVDTVTPL